MVTLLLHIDDQQKVESLQEPFNRCFPHLKIELFSNKKDESTWALLKDHEPLTHPSTSKFNFGFLDKGPVSEEITVEIPIK